MITWGDLKEQIYREDDLSEEVFASSDEIIGYANDGLSSIEKDIHALGGQKYFETKITTPVVAGQDGIKLPQSIYAYKVTAILDLDNQYELLPIRNKRELLEYKNINGCELLRYKVINLPLTFDPLSPSTITGGGLTLELYPKPIADFNCTIYYIRKVARIIDDSSVIEIPEAEEFLKAYVIERTLNKERLSQDREESPRTAQLRKQLLDSLASMFEDENNLIEIDTEFYCGHN